RVHGLFLRGIDEPAGVDDDHVRRVGRAHGEVIAGAEDALDAFAIGDVLRTAEGDEVVAHLWMVAGEGRRETGGGRREAGGGKRNAGRGMKQGGRRKAGGRGKRVVATPSALGDDEGNGCAALRLRAGGRI